MTAQPSAEALGPTDELDDDDDVAAVEYDILSSPNDWNVLTIVSYLDSGAIQIPFFQRHYIWDLKRASRLIESLIVGLPVPQIFLYEEERNKYLVIDGQQRLLTLFFFLKGRFPRTNRRGHLSQLLRQNELDDLALADDELFQDFKLNLPAPEGAPTNRFHRLKYTQLADWQSTLDLRPLRNVIVKQLAPSGHDAMFEIFNRLNSGGVNLSAQEIRASLYRSTLMHDISRLNSDLSWRQLIGRPEPDSRMQDMEVLLRTLAIAENHEHYKSPMTSFVNAFCISARGWTEDRAAGTTARLGEIIHACVDAGPASFRRLGKFSPLLFEAVATVAWKSDIAVESDAVRRLAEDGEFVSSLQEGSTKPTNVARRINAARRILEGS